KKKVKDTEYGIGWLPLGGYVKISGMIDESMDKEQMKKDPEPWEFRSKPSWQRLIVMIAGVTMNVLLAFFIFAMILWTWGEQKVPMAGLKYGVEINDSLAYKLGFEDGDKILSVNGDKVVYFEDLNGKMLYAKSVEVKRGDSVFNLTMPENLVAQIIKSKEKGRLFTPAIPTIVDSIPPESEAGSYGLRKGDQIVAVAHEKTPFFGLVRQTLGAHKNRDIAVTVLRNGDRDTLNMHVSGEGTLGFFPVSDFQRFEDMGVLEVSQVKYGFFAAFPAGVNMAIDKLSAYVKSFSLIFKP